jgi:hypothetical protein
MGRWAFMSIAADFQFWIGNICVLREPYWNIGELAMQLNWWLRGGMPTDFQYDCMDAEENDLFSLKKVDECFIFYSAWANENTLTMLSKADLVDFITEFSGTVKSSIKQQLNLDADAFLDN